MEVVGDKGLQIQQQPLLEARAPHKPAGTDYVAVKHSVQLGVYSRDCVHDGFGKASLAGSDVGRPEDQLRHHKPFVAHREYLWTPASLPPRSACSHLTAAELEQERE